jgi:large subunit ribosomal protein L6
MSRIGKKPIVIPTGVEVKIEGREVTVKGPKGTLKHTIPAEHITLQMEGNVLNVIRDSEERKARSFHGLTRTMISNMIDGVTKLFSKKLEIKGVGYRCLISGKILKLELGFSHPVDMPIPEGITVEQDQKNKNLITIAGIDKQLVGQFAAEIRKHRLPEPYKGKGILYEGEVIIRKAGKTASSGA